MSGMSWIVQSGLCHGACASECIVLSCLPVLGYVMSGDFNTPILLLLILLRNADGFYVDETSWNVRSNKPTDCQQTIL